MALFVCFLLCYLGETTLIDFIYSSKSISNVCSTGPVINYSERMQRKVGICQSLPKFKGGGAKSIEVVWGTQQVLATQNGGRRAQEGLPL